jgi:hypothetical protein
MQQWVISYLRFVGFSAFALAIIACAKLAPAEAAVSRPEPLISDPPETSQMAADPSTGPTEAERIATLEAQVEALGAEISHLRKALDVLGPLPEHADLFIPVAKSEIAGEPEDEAAARLAQLYAPAPWLSGARSLFYEVELGSFANQQAAEARWKQLIASNRLAGIEPRYAAAGSEIRLAAGPLMSEAAVDALCVELSALAGPCRGVAPIRAY